MFFFLVVCVGLAGKFAILYITYLGYMYVVRSVASNISID